MTALIPVLLTGQADIVAFTIKRNCLSASLKHNKQLAQLFQHMADCYAYLGKEQRFRSSAYENAAKTLSNLQEPVDVFHDDIKELDTLKGIGESIAEKIVEFLHTGKIKKFEELKKKVPYRLFDLLEVEGIGPSTLRLLHEQLHISTKEELAAAIEQQKLSGTKGLSKQKTALLQRALKPDVIKQRIPLAQAQRLGNEIVKSLQQIKGLHHITLAGSVRRQKETIGDIDIICTATAKERKKITQQITRLPFVEKVIAAGATKISFLHKHAIQVDIRIVKEDEFGAALFYFTGSKEHNIQLRTIAKQRGWKINEYGVFDEQTGNKLAGTTEEEIYTLFGLKWIAPPLRMGKDELKKAGLQVNKSMSA